MKSKASKPLELGEQRSLPPLRRSQLTPAQRKLIKVSVERFSDACTLQLIFTTSADRYHEMDGELALDFCRRIRRAAKRRLAEGTRSVMRCGPGLTTAQRNHVEVEIRHDNTTRWLRIAFIDGDVFDVPPPVADDLALRLEQAEDAMTVGAA